MNPLITITTTNLNPFKSITAREIRAKQPKVKTAGIIGGLGPQSTSLFYQTYTQYCLENQLSAFPRLIINSVNMWEVIEILADKDMDRLFNFLRKEVEMIQDQVDFIVMVCNSVHAVLDQLRAVSKVPILSIYEEVCKDIARSSSKKVGILGTKTTTDSQFYQQELEGYGINHEVLPDAQGEAIDNHIFEEMLRGRDNGTMKQLLLDGIAALQAKGCDSVVLACTELPIFVSQEDTNMPLFLSTQILAHTVVKECYASDAEMHPMLDAKRLRFFPNRFASV